MLSSAEAPFWLHGWMGEARGPETCMRDSGSCQRGQCESGHEQRHQGLGLGSI